MSSETEWVMLAKRVQRWLEDKYGFLVHVQDVECALRSRYFDDAAAPQPPAEAQAVAWRRQGTHGWTFTDSPHARDIAVGVWEPLYAAPAEAQAQGGGGLDEVVCLACGDHIMPKGQVCHACSHPVSEPPSAPVGVEE